MAVEVTDPTPGALRVQPRRLVMPGTRAGRYQIVELLGVGGMGEVYRATDVVLDRPVAIKVVRGDLVGRSPETLLREAQAMAKLSHPNVVVVYEVGTVDDEVFMAMEYVDGQTARSWMRATRRSRRELLDVFLAAGRGLEAAHAAGIVHRDFKPDNVLIGKDGRVRVADFGLAGASGKSGEEDALPDLGDVGSVDTIRFSAMASGTPAYMSPEQHLRQIVDARSDQFAFCVALWEALTGTRPFAGRTHTELRRNVAAGQIAPPAIELPAWLRAVLLRGLAVAREDRYPSMAELLADLGHDPAVRRRRALAAVAIPAAALAIFFAARRGGEAAPKPCAGAELRLAGVWDAPVKAAVRLAFVATGRVYAADTYDLVAAKLDAYSAGWTAMRTEACEATAVRREQSPAVLDRRMECLDRRLGELGALTAVFARAPDPATVDRAASAAGRLEDLATCADTELLGATLPMPTDPTLRARVSADRAKIQEAHALELTGKAKDALAGSQTLLPEAEQLGYLPLEVEVVGEMFRTEGLLRMNDEQLAMGRRLLLLAARLHDDGLVARCWTDLMVTVGVVAHRPDEALGMASAAETAVLRAGDTPAARGRYLAAVGRVLVAKADNRGAEPKLREAIALLEAAGDDNALGAAVNELGGVLLFTGRYDEAKQALSKELAIYERQLSPNHPYVGGALENLAMLLQRQGHLEEARALDERALAIFSAVAGPDSLDAAALLNNIGSVYLDEGAYDEARTWLERAAAIKEKQAGAASADLASTLVPLGLTLAQLGRVAEGQAAVTRARAILEKEAGADSPDFADAVRAAALIDALRGDCPRGIVEAEHAIAIDEKAYDRGHPDLAPALRVIGECDVRAGRPRAALAPLERALFITVSRGAAPDEMPEVELALAEAEWRGGGGEATAVGLAAEARRGFAALGPHREARAAAATEWLAAHKAR